MSDDPWNFFDYTVGCPVDQAMGCLLWVFFKKATVLCQDCTLQFQSWVSLNRLLWYITIHMYAYFINPDTGSVSRVAEYQIAWDGHISTPCGFVMP